jgi:acetylornithine deacetylase/succinyl-diaminopimelate desuccinylase-like protein
MTELLFDGKRAYAHLYHVAVEIDGRLGGSDGERQAADYIADYFRSLGLEVRRQEFPVRNYTLVEKCLEILDPPLGEVTCEAVWLTADTSPEGLEGDIYFLDIGAEEEIGPAVEGKIVLTLGGVRGVAYERFMRFKPLAVVYIEMSVGTPPIRIEAIPEVRAKFGAIPSVRIAHEDGVRLVKAGARRARVVVRTTEAEATSQNVIGELRGTLFPDEIVVIGGHYDTSIGIQGASDNTGGTVLVMELARVFCQIGSRRTIRFVAWGSEELGLRGSVFYIKDLKKRDKEGRKAEGFVKGRDRTELEQHRLYVNLDVHGAILGQNHAMILGPADLTAAARLLAKEAGMAHEVEEDVYSSDCTPLSEGGIPSIAFHRFGGTSSYLHSPRDVIDWLSPDVLERNGRFVELFLRRYVAEAAVLPFERKIPEEHQKKIRDYLEKRLRIDYYADEEEEKKE